MRIFSNEWKEKLKISARKRKHNPHSEETKKKISNALKGRKLSWITDEIRKENGKKMRGQKREHYNITMKNSGWFKKGHSRSKGKKNSMFGKIPWNKGKNWSEEVIQKMSLSSGGDGFSYKGYLRIKQKIKCERCYVRKSSTRNLSIHHKDRNTRNNSKENLEVLCDSCHMKEHLEEINKKRREEKFIR